MKVSKNHLQTLAFFALYLFAIYYWTQPLQERKLPYGEFDAISHFEVADYISYNDKSFMKLPHYIDLRYGFDNKFKPHTLWYPPTFHASLAAQETISGNRVVGVFLMNTILATFILISVYFITNSLFGFLPAILSAMLLIFSPRDYMPFLWGQWPERFAYALVPLILYCYYKYYLSNIEGKTNPTYIYLMSFFLGINILVHPMVFFHSAAGLAVLYILLAIKNKKLAFNWRHYIGAFCVFLVLFLMFPYQTFNVFSTLKKTAQESNTQAPQAIAEQSKLTRLFHWSLDPKGFEGSVPPWYFSFREMHGIWTVSFLILGLLVLLIRRENKDIFLLAWLFSLYIVLHRDLLGIITFLHRSLSATAHIFAPITAIGAVYAVSLLKMPPKYTIIAKYSFAIVFIYFTISVNMAYASNSLNSEIFNPEMQSGFFTVLSKDQFEAAQWNLENVPESHNLTALGIPHQEGIISATARKIRWSAAIAQRPTKFFPFDNSTLAQMRIKNDYLMFDYTMLGPLGMKDFFDELQGIEANISRNKQLLYNKNNIRVYAP